MNKTLKDSLKLLAITLGCNWCLFIPYFIYYFFGAPGLNDNVNEEILIATISIVAELIMFSIIGSRIKFNRESLLIYFALSIPFCFIATALRGYGSYEMMMLNMIVPSYDSFAKSLIFPISETVFKTVVLLISSIIAKYKTKNSTSC